MRNSITRCSQVCIQAEDAHFVSISSGDCGSEDLTNILGKMKPRDHVDPPSYLWPRWLAELITFRDSYEIVHAKDKISVGAILFAWVLHIAFWYLAAVYLDNINPGKFGSAKPWYYLCKVKNKVLAITCEFDGKKLLSRIRQICRSLF